MSSPMEPARITGVILAGGRGQRMGGVDKGLVDFRGRPLAAWAVERFGPQVDELLINANRNARRYAAFGPPVFGDDLEDFPGPLAGLHAALGHAAHPLVATVPCDSPLLPLDLVARLLAGLREHDAEVAVARALGRGQPVFCLCRRELRASLGAYLAGGGRAMERWFAAQRVAWVDFDDCAEGFHNLNTAAELDEAARAG
ncbi:molybdenum cofactor guanylyltransferase [Pseudothauera nasutitermitis]|uniref:Molybdenum cofactor guanylyltransferase n=1 Tax=Pseudothauera nasutitermitis TaxID=2565930 RepID=A0A4S4AWZ3_9RHOO|nr:molybdenum cofactor guanylyltransferase MobA [Pseudothauera nasutitermitis]THF64585.1 molybdenum cofactor guanylyltransferase [Pseudothauera nasutitermitis]